LSGNGIIKIESPNDDLTFKLNNNVGKNINITNLNIVIQRISTINDGTLPVELSSFDAFVISSESVGLNWTVQSESNGNFYRIYRHDVNDFNTSVLLDDTVPAQNLSQTHTYSFVDNNIAEVQKYLFYWLEFVELDNTSQVYGPAMVLFENGEEDVAEVVNVEGIRSAYPNPFNPNVTISYYLSSPKSAIFEIYNLKGQLVKVLTSGVKNEGNHKVSWNGKDSFENSVASGLYLIKPVNLSDKTTRKIMLSK